MKYRKGYKYQLAEDELFITKLYGYNIITKRIELHPDGSLIVREGYACDGPSGPTIDRRENMSAAVLHDALYELMRKALLLHLHWPEADAEYGKQMKKCGAWDITVAINIAGLKFMNGKCALPKNRKKVYEVIS